MKLKIFVLLNLIFLLLNLFGLDNNYKLYKNEKAKFYFEYSSNDFIVSENYNDTSSSEKINVVVQVDEIDRIEKEAPLGYDRGSAINEKENLDNGIKGSGIDFASDVELLKLDNKYAEISTILSRYSVEDITFERKLLFFNNNYRIIITVYGNTDNIIKANTDFFDYEKGANFYLWTFNDKGDILLDFISSIKNGKKTNPVVTWFNSVYQIAKSIKFNSNENIIYTPTVDKLRFRETPTLDGKFIRMLNKSDKLQLLETGNSEAINGTKGTWVKVKTEKGEVGWCFDAYLEEVKKN